MHSFPLWPDHEIFLQATLYEKVRFCRFPANFRKKMGEFAASIERSKAKCFSFRGASPPNPATRGSAPGPRWGLRPQIPVIGSRSARSACPPPLPNPKYATWEVDDFPPVISPCRIVLVPKFY